MSVIQGVRAPIGSVLIDDGSLANAGNIQALNGSQLTKSTPQGTAAYQAYKLLYGKYCTFNANTSGSIVNNKTDNSGSTDGTGYTTSASTELSGTYAAYKAVDSNTEATFWESGVVYDDNYWQIQKDSGKFTFFGISIHVNTNNFPAGNNIRSGNIYLYDGTTLKEFIPLRNLSWTATETKIWYPSGIYNITKVKIDIEAIQTAGSFPGLVDVRLLPADLTKIKCTGHGKPTATAVNFAPKIGETLPTGISENTTYYLRSVDSNNITIHPTATDATNNTNAISITAAGSGEFYMEDSGKVTLPTVTNGKLYY